MAKFICQSCRDDFCDLCNDILHVVMGERLTCNCKCYGHDGEPRNVQILDPITGEIFAPGLKVTKDGEVKYSE